jgi:type VI secretion system protein ImpG
MSEALYRHYERELLFIRQMAQEFARQYPAVANRLLLEPNRSADPHVERLIEAFALLTARVQQKLDDEFPELTEALLSVLYPHYLAPVPSLAVVQFEADPTTATPAGVTIPRHSKLHAPRAGKTSCQFRTGYPVTLWPVALTDARLQPPPFPAGWQPPPRTAAALRLQLECQGEFAFHRLDLDTLRFYLYGDSQIIGQLYELIFNHTLQVAFRPLDASARAPAVVLRPDECLGQVGFGRDEGLLPYPNQSFLGYRLLTEFFSFPPKFLFVDLSGFREAARAGLGKRLEVTLALNRTLASLEQAVGAKTFRLGCTPVVNLFEQTAEPIPLTHKRYEYRIVPDVHQPDGMEVYSVDQVVSADPQGLKEYRPFYAFHHDGGDGAAGEAFWYASRRPSLREGDRGTEVFLHFTDPAFNPRLPAEAVVLVRTTCTNRDVPVELQQAGEALRFDLEAAVPLRAIRCLRTPTAPLRPPLRRGAHRRLLSHLALNHLSITDAVEGKAALQEMLRLYDFADPQAGRQLAAVNRNLIDGITAVESRRVVGRIGGPASSGFCRGVEVTIEFDEQKYVGTGVFLFACVLERFLGLYASMNSFTQLVARMKQADGPLKRWPPRAGEGRLL